MCPYKKTTSYHLSTKTSLCCLWEPSTAFPITHSWTQLDFLSISCWSSVIWASVNNITVWAFSKEWSMGFFSFIWAMIITRRNSKFHSAVYPIKSLLFTWRTILEISYLSLWIKNTQMEGWRISILNYRRIKIDHCKKNTD